MNKKILFLVLLAVIFLPLGVYGIASPTQIAENVKDAAVTIGAAIVVIGWVVSGILFLMAAGNPTKVETAKKAMIASIIGTVLVIIASPGYDAIKGFIDSIIGEAG